MYVLKYKWNFALLLLQSTIYLILHCFRVKCISIKYCVNWYVEIWASTLGRLLEVAPVFHTFPIHWSCYFMRYSSFAFHFQVAFWKWKLCAGIHNEPVGQIALSLLGRFWGCYVQVMKEHSFICRTLLVSCICLYLVWNISISITIVIAWCVWNWAWTSCCWKPFPLIIHRDAFPTR